MKRKYFVILGIIAVALLLSYKYIYKTHREISGEEATYTVTTQEIVNEYKTNEEKANLKYSDKTIIINGKITELDVSTKSIVLDGKLYGMMEQFNENIKINEAVSLKGRFLGYDDLLEEMKMDQITLNK